MQLAGVVVPSKALELPGVDRSPSEAVLLAMEVPRGRTVEVHSIAAFEAPVPEGLLGAAATTAASLLFVENRDEAGEKDSGIGAMDAVINPAGYRAVVECCSGWSGGNC